MLKNRVQYILLFLLVLCLYFFSDSYFLLFVLVSLLLVPLCSLSLLLFSYRKLSFKAEASLSSGESPEIAYVLENAGIFPAVGFEWELALKNNLNGGAVSQRIRASVKRKSREEIRLSLADARTGKIIAGTQKARFRDFMGLFALKVVPPPPLSIYVFPKISAVEQAGQNQTETDGDCVSYSQHRPGSDVNEIFALHEYAEGDDLRKVHWKLSAKTDLLMVRDFGLPLNSRITLLLELMTDKNVRESQEDDTGSFCLDVLASLSDSFARRGIIHNIAWFDDEYKVLQLEQIAAPEDLQTALPVLLEAKCYDSGRNALDAYLQAEGTEGLYYITASADSSLFTKLPRSAIIISAGVSANNESEDEPKIISVRRGADSEPVF